ncbi:MAG: hypothetical protein CBC48_18365 [bacterium TMED88]|nr:hypothetical protein [Deltaproteobacteria bacterium]OUV23754.1 MAG: hypothetical protein CBC48_18365 [bacterium TMED88]
MSREILMPQVASDMTEADVVAWLVRPGDRFEAGDLLLEIETEKSTVEIEAPAAGALAEILVPAGTPNVAVGTLLAHFEESAEAAEIDGEGAAAENTEAASASETEPDLNDLGESTEEDAARLAPESRPPATALARRLADRSGVNLEGLRGSGPHGRVTRDDVERRNDDSGALQSAEPKLDSGPGMEGTGFSLELTIQCQADALTETLDRLHSISRGEGSASPIRDIILRAVEHAGLSVPAFFSPRTTGEAAPDAIRVIAELPSGSEANPPSQADLLVVELGQPGLNMVRWGPVSPQFPRILGVGSPREAALVRDGDVRCGQVLNLHLAVDPKIVPPDVAAEWANAVRESIEAPLTLLL